MFNPNAKLTMYLALSLLTPASYADGLFGAGHYLPGAANVRDMTMPAQAGFVYEQYNLQYSSGDLKDKNGDSVGANTDFTSSAIAPLFMWTTDYEVLGARYSFYVSPTLVQTDVRGEKSTGVGDTFIQPLWLGWLNEDYDINLGVGFYLPTGASDISLDMTTAQVQLSGYYYFMDKASALMLSTTYEYHGEVDKTGVTPGNHLTIEYGYSQYLTQQLEVGIKGYSQWQVDNDELTGSLDNVNQTYNTSLGNQSEVHGLGLQVAYWLDPNWNLALNYVKEFGAKSRHEGEMISLNITYSFNAIY